MPPPPLRSGDRRSLGWYAQLRDEITIRTASAQRLCDWRDFGGAHQEYESLITLVELTCNRAWILSDERDIMCELRDGDLPYLYAQLNVCVENYTA